MYYVVFLIIPLLLCVSCVRAEEGGEVNAAEDWPGRRARMVEQLRAYRVDDKRVLQAMGKVRRHVYIPEAHRNVADPYGDHPCPIGLGQTISQPFIVAYMTGKMKLIKGEKVLEIGTGSGYQAAILAEMGAAVYSIEIVPELAEHARKVLAAEGYDRVRVRTGDGYKGWPEHGPFDAIVVTCAPEQVPSALVDQLSEGGRMILPVGGISQRLVILRKKDGKIRKEDDIAVRFVPMVRGKKKRSP
ncbi:MAG: protein-L-isoaspartate(D-aspartate) O-methyltransferase [Lentisphaerae bacterium]|nr:protein-L-isoaspartate(D-aspartate) O-methyltransferase [Lentisphaerota bacterium]